MKKSYRIQWTEIVTYETYIEADSPEKAKELLMDGYCGDIEDIDRTMNYDDYVYVDGQPL